MTRTYKHLKQFDKSELIAIIKDCDNTIEFLSKQLRKG